MRKQRACPHIGIRGVASQTSAIADWNKGAIGGEISERMVHRDIRLEQFQCDNGLSGKLDLLVN
ncbi:MAG: hypothetical protein QHJ82_11580, partial [Verrucomicrobiota bacterium]|nr:hypothetical protein [Verrucomicrobiota bacterium]